MSLDVAGMRTVLAWLRIAGPECPSCGRDNSEYDNICTSDDCPGVLDEETEL